MEQAITLTSRSGHRTAAILATPAGRTDQLAILCHGFLSHKNSTTNKALTPTLVDQGIAVLRLDFFGTGDSEGPFECITVTEAVNQASAALDHAASMGYGRLGLMGSSFGGLVAILAAGGWTERGSRLAALALKCPVPDFPEMLRLEFGVEGMERWKATNEIPNVTGGPDPIRLRYGFYEDCLAHDAFKAAAAIQASTLIVQGEQDEYVPLHQSRRLLEALNGKKRLEILPGADHGFTRGEDFRTMTKLLADWMITHVSSHPG